MEWRDEGIIIGLRRHGETSVILEAMTRAHGRHLGLVRGGRGRQLAPILQPGNSVELTWRARLDEHLGNFAVEVTEARAASFLGSAAALYALNTIAEHLRLLPERDPHEPLYQALQVVLEHIAEARAACALIARFEVALLADLGFGLDLNECAATGATQDLIWVSPKSGRAVCREAGKPFEDKLLALPDFLKPTAPPSLTDSAALASAFKLTGYFLERHVLQPRGLPMPDARLALLALATKSTG